LFVPKPYRDSGGVPTIGYGSQITEAQAIQWKDGITEAQAQAMYEGYMQALGVKLRQCPLAGLSQNQNDAIFSLAYNIGINAFLNSTIYKQLMCRGIDLSSWLLFIHDQHGNIDQGLIRRRQMELKLFIWGLY
jgi:lysozyme